MRNEQKIVSINETKVVRQKVDGLFQVSRKEYIKDVTFNSDGSDLFQKIEINPGLPETFPWASNIAKNFDRYRFKTLKLVYEPATATIVPGIVAMTLEFDVNEAMPVTKKNMFQYQYLTQSPPYRRFEIDLLSSDSRTLSWMFTRGPIVNPGDLRLSDPMYVILYTGGINSNSGFVGSFVGELWIEYHLEFKNPQISPWQISVPRAIFLLGGVKPTLPMGLIGAKNGDLAIEYKNPTLANGEFFFNDDFTGTVNVEVTYAEIVSQISGAQWQAADVGTWTIDKTPSDVVIDSIEGTLGRFFGTFTNVAFSGSFDIECKRGSSIKVTVWPMFFQTQFNDGVFTNCSFEFISRRI